VVVYISKMSPIGTKSKKLIAFGRVFSGTVHSGNILRALRTNGTESKAKITAIKICGVGGRMHGVQSARAGLIALEGVDDALHEAGTLTDSAEGRPIRHMNFTVKPVIQHSVRPREKRNLVKMVSEFHRISIQIPYIDLLLLL